MHPLVTRFVNERYRAYERIETLKETCIPAEEWDHIIESYLKADIEPSIVELYLFLEQSTLYPETIEDLKELLPRTPYDEEILNWIAPIRSYLRARRLQRTLYIIGACILGGVVFMATFTLISYQQGQYNDPFIPAPFTEPNQT